MSWLIPTNSICSSSLSNYVERYIYHWRLILIVCSSFCLHKVALAEAATISTPKVEEAFIEFQINNKVDGFYRVLMDTHEQPYLPVKSVLQEWLELTVNCETRLPHCQATLYPQEKNFWIDAQSKQLGEKDSSVTAILAEGKILYRNGEIWLRHDAWESWLPLTLTWSLQNYSLRIQPHFPLKTERAALREQNRTIARNQLQEKRAYDNAVALGPNTHSLIIDNRITYTGRLQNTGDSSGELSLDHTQDLAQGTLMLNARQSTDSPSLDLDYIRYQRYFSKRLHVLEMGDTRFPGSLLVNSANLSKGVMLRKMDSSAGNGTFSYRGRTDTGSSADLFRNGYFEESLIVNSSGFYEITERFATANDQFTVKIYLPNGRELEERFLVSSDNGRLLPRHEWDAQLFYGNNENTRESLSEIVRLPSEKTHNPFYYWVTRYGISENFSVGAGYAQTPNTYSNGNTTQPDNISNPFWEFTWRPRYTTTLFFEQMHHKYGRDNTSRVSTHLGQLHNILLTHQSFEQNSPLLFSVANTNSARDATTLEHQAQWHQYTFNTKIVSETEQDAWESLINIRLKNDLATRLFHKSQFLLQDSTQNRILRNSTIGIDYRPKQQFSFTLDRNFTDSTHNWSLQARWRGNKFWALPSRMNQHWVISLSTDVNDSGSSTYSASFTWHWHDDFYVSLSKNDQLTIAEFSWQLGLQSRATPHPFSSSQPHTWSFKKESSDHIGNAYVYGQVRSPDGHPLAGVEIRTPSGTTATNKAGYYKLHGLPTHDKLALQVNPNSLDASMIPSPTQIYVNLRPATELEWNPSVRWTVGLDGVLLTDRAIPADAMLQVREKIGGKVIGTYPIEEDGFFIAEGLTNTTYELEILNITPKAPVVDIKFLKNEDWLSGIVIPWCASEIRCDHHNANALQTNH